ncbi:acyl carrier protein [Desulfuromonas acetoxidans]|uniref:Acyl-carrier protein-like n=1 Tax=Desulfuromonas acetoxidans (strain DSM 684 / 11070) TaxID=281689 RepID=Q1K0S2_DESA6|nr:phosphopantetheine-binding protein [Desulfuromonas acetoxidans]EAT15869.1 acyl-carrier protein-like [Desulfuromonas acetoxidans DSM 684]MBF0646877.1 acyl carrier protein [Desulfuromonas acetoxidans]NVD24469.1 acyl carrier protein [Desulfuromonas acetoxidans]NVE16582.1 acyl carrier protein [Desulfuromonas acetoxidans]
MSRQQLYRELQDLIIEACHIQEEYPDLIDPQVSLIGPDSPLGLDSLDAVEIVVAVQRHYNVRIGGEDTGREALDTLNALADFVESHTS